MFLSLGVLFSISEELLGLINSLSVGHHISKKSISLPVSSLIIFSCVIGVEERTLPNFGLVDGLHSRTLGWIESLSDAVIVTLAVSFSLML